MYKDKTFLVIIPARGGSKGLPGKNIRPLCGNPLIAWSIESGRHSMHVDEVMVSTDSEEIAEIARRFGASVPFLRPIELAQDKTPTFDAVLHTINYYREIEKRGFDYIVLLEPTSPLRESDDIDSMIEAVVDQAERYDAITSIGEVHEHPSIMKRIVDHSLEPFCKELSQETRRQDNSPAYFPYGVAYIVKTEILLKEKTFYPERSTYYLIQRYQAYEIDDLYDFLCVEVIMQHRKEKI
ncbi:MAG: acylneuraminate cytidylyltransferase family protein [Proteobacteria bacterium]|nr:acylneuraminate cytidylyltransferase family protein [Pseudomonadota bacterium]MBU1688666.1 acylneuraminate cytidylyltransferase family protein [Pseudomonadota bacterium]